MGFATTNEKARILNLVYRLVNSVYGPNIVIKRDPLHRKYEVNRYNVYLSQDKSSNDVTCDNIFKSIKLKLIEKLNARIENRFGALTLIQETKNSNEVRITLEKNNMNDDICIMIH